MLAELWEGSLANPAQRIFWLYILSSALIALIYTLYQMYRHPLSSQDKTLGQQLKAYLLHPSALLDYRYFFIGTLIKVGLVAPLIISVKTIAIWVFKGLAPYIGTPITALSYEAIAILYTLCLFVVSDFSRYILHRWMHKNKYLWQFHKVHHSAPLLNPLTFYRVHPIENFLFGLRYAISVGIMTGVFLSLFGPRINMWTVLGANGFVFIFSLLGTHLRHSHLFVTYPKWLERFFISPAMHQIHHYKGYGRYNYGGYLAIWDKLFHSWLPSKAISTKPSFGMPQQEMQKYQNVSQLLFQPFRALIRLKRTS
ncbi:sterol desaturase family protein [Pelistega sp. NLN82]|uniref:Sterol desaturase family protein n=1 Tax=Pelistega ratti TaxID=2652177 RepID=A0A6L9Y584_9BURK|nr:sterol desaturase family protein [Pelistega ratti]NEN75513.1 sterol desaturase family protein [Pelistega ratti]